MASYAMAYISKTKKKSKPLDSMASMHLSTWEIIPFLISSTNTIHL